MSKKLKSDHMGQRYGPKRVENGLNLRFFDMFAPLATSRRVQPPIMTPTHMNYRYVVVFKHHSLHFGPISGCFKGPKVLKNCIFSGFRHIPLCGVHQKG